MKHKEIRDLRSESSDQKEIRDQVARGPRGPGLTEDEHLRTKGAQQLLADLFAKNFLRPHHTSIAVFWLKVVAEHVMGGALGLDRVWIAEAEVLRALKAEGFKVRLSKGRAYVGARPAGDDRALWRYFKRGGRLEPKRATR